MSAKILVAVDFSPITDSVIHWATSLACARGDALILLYVQQPPAEAASEAILFPLPPREDACLRRSLESLKSHDPAVLYEHRLTLGPAPEEILRIAAEEDVDLIVMGSHGRGWLGQILMGSVVQGVMRQATCPVLVVSPPCAAATAKACSAGQAAQICASPA